MCPEVRLFHLVLNLFQATENLPASEQGRFAPSSPTLFLPGVFQSTSPLFFSDACPVSSSTMYDNAT